MINTYDYKVKWCPICNQGWVEIVKDVRTGQLFCCCSECESEWDDASNIVPEETNSPEKYEQICDPNEEEISKKGWDRYIIH